MAVNLKTARRTIEVVNPLPSGTVAELTRQTVDGFVAAQKALLDVMARPARKPAPAETVRRGPRKRAARGSRAHLPATA